MNIEISPEEYEKFLNFDDAKLYCELLEIDGKTDWRLPTAYELYSYRMDAGLYWVVYDVGEGYATTTKYRVRPVREL